jgi:Fe2+ or Zn2+ uptake regulation protein
MSQPYHNTTGLSGEQLERRIEQAESQEEVVEALFEAHPAARLTPFEVQDVALPNSPITSVRRAITNLTDQGVLRKTDHQKEGPHGDPNYTWTLNREPTLFDQSNIDP